ncbi:MAG: 50S ribosomal protein L32 [Endomicrobiia bacterium]
MPNPKKHHSNMRTRMRRSQWKVSAPNTIRCPQCGNYKLSHRICPNCGYYKGELWVSKKEKTKQEDKTTTQQE